MTTEQILSMIDTTMQKLPQAQSTLTETTDQLKLAIKTQLVLQAIATACVVYLAYDTFSRRR